MQTKRRLWLKQIGLGIAGIGLANVQTYAAPVLSADFIGNHCCPIKKKGKDIE